MNIRIALQFCFVFSLWASAGMAVQGELQHNGGANDNPHNLSSLTNGLKTPDIHAVDETQICKFCHLPHGASLKSSLWGRPSPNTLAFPTYVSGTLVINSGNSDYNGTEYPNGSSKMCLSCHDGITAIGNLRNGDFLDVTGPAGGGIDSTMSFVGSTLYFDVGRDLDLTTTHPVSFTYDLGLVTTITSQKGAGTYYLPSSDFLDSDARVQCTTCHEPHFDTRTATYSLPFWRQRGGATAADDYNNTCVECHSSGTLGPSSDGHPLPPPL